MKIEEVLQSLGLNEKETMVYLALLPIGSVPASMLGKRTGITRSTAQYTCQQLEKKGLIKVIQKNNAFIYSPEPPEKLLFLLDNQKKQIEEKEDSVKRIIGDLKGMINPNVVLPKVNFYEGKEGMIELYEQILTLNSPIDSFEDKGEMTNFIKDYANEFIKKRIEKGIFNRVICPATNQINITSKKELRETRTIDVKLYPFTGDIKICKDQVSIFSFQKNLAMGIAIKHEDIANNFRDLFEYLWRSLGSKPVTGRTK